MGKKSLEMLRKTTRKIRPEQLSAEERATMRRNGAYEGSPYHKKNPGDFGLTPPSQPRADKTLCDEAGIVSTKAARALFDRAISGGLVSQGQTPHGFPKQLWVVDETGRVFEAMEGGSRPGCYHGYPVRRDDPFFATVSEAWRQLP